MTDQQKKQIVDQLKSLKEDARNAWTEATVYPVPRTKKQVKQRTGASQLALQRHSGLVGQILGIQRMVNILGLDIDTSPFITDLRPK